MAISWRKAHIFDWHLGTAVQDCPVEQLSPHDAVTTAVRGAAATVCGSKPVITLFITTASDSYCIEHLCNTEPYHGQTQCPERSAAKSIYAGALRHFSVQPSDDGQAHTPQQPLGAQILTQTVCYKLPDARTQTWSTCYMARQIRGAWTPRPLLTCPALAALCTPALQQSRHCLRRRTAPTTAGAPARR